MKTFLLVAVTIGTLTRSVSYRDETYKTLSYMGIITVDYWILVYIFSGSASITQALVTPKIFYVNPCYVMWLYPLQLFLQHLQWMCIVLCCRLTDLYRNANLSYSQSIHRAIPYSVGLLTGYFLQRHSKIRLTHVSLCIQEVKI